MSFNKAADSRARLIQQMIPVRHLKYLRKNFDELILAYSGGTDSTLLLLIMHDYNIQPDHIVFGNTGIEYPETVKNIHETLEKLGYLDRYTEIYPEISTREIAQYIIEDFDKTFACSKRYDKSDYRCCYYAKEMPMKKWLQGSGYDEDSTCILRGLKLVDSSGRMLSGATLIETGQFYYYKYKYGKNAKCANPIQLVTEKRKSLWLPKLCEKHGVTVPDKSGCSICPIYYRYAKGEERETARFQIAQRYIENNSPQLMPYYLKENKQ